jgi:hypothetical protein
VRAWGCRNMDELERQLRDLAAHRASQVPEFDATSLTAAVDDGNGPHWGALLAIAALIVALLVGGGYALFGRNDSGNVRVVAAPSSSAAPDTSAAPVTTPPVTTPAVTTPATTIAPCPVNTNDTAGQSGNGTVTSVPPLAVLQSITALPAQCVDQVTFKFASTVGSWSIGYQQGPLAQEISGQPVTVAGNAYLVLRLKNTNTAASLPSDFVPDSSTGVREITKIQDFEGVVTWVIGLDSARAFGVSTDTPGQITVELAR